MKTLLLAGALTMLMAGPAAAAEQGTINQAGPYEATMQFYLHPAHGFPGKAETTQTAAKADTVQPKPKSDAPATDSRQTSARPRARKDG
jgi:hypothetical protein